MFSPWPLVHTLFSPLLCSTYYIVTSSDFWKDQNMSEEELLTTQKFWHALTVDYDDMLGQLPEGLLEPCDVSDPKEVARVLVRTFPRIVPSTRAVPNAVIEYILQ